MTRRAWWPDYDAEGLEPIERQSITVFEEDRDDWSGLYDAAGNKLMRPRQPFGFRRER